MTYPHAEDRMNAPPSYRQIAEANLSKAAGHLNSLPQGDVPTQTVIAGAALAQALGTLAVAQALLEIGDVLRARTGGEPSALPDFRAMIRDEIQRANLMKGKR